MLVTGHLLERRSAHLASCATDRSRDVGGDARVGHANTRPFSRKQACVALQFSLLPVVVFDKPLSELRILMSPIQTAFQPLVKHF